VSRIHGVAELGGDLPPLGHGLVLATQHQGGRDGRLTEFGEQRLGYHVPGGRAIRSCRMARV
jgi:hypothetical protein